jgi:DNA invertase Pin-like site-specific DNA recombinase
MDLASASVTAPAPSRAAQYVRMSTEHQQYSPENQLEINREDEAAHNMEISQDYSHCGPSRLNIAGRTAPKLLLADVEDSEEKRKHSAAIIKSLIEEALTRTPKLACKYMDEWI